MEEVPEEPRERDEAVTSSEQHQHWDEKIGRSGAHGYNTPLGWASQALGKSDF